jgi:outer membrane immunogenic protein
MRTVDGETLFDEEGITEGNGALFGVHAGYMFDFGRVVAGAELDYDRAQIGLDNRDEFFDEEAEIGEIESIARAKLRLGFDADRVLPYVTAGLARASIDFNEVATETYGTELEDSYSGRFMGIGANFAVSENLMIGIEALRHDFDDLPAAAGEPFPEGAELETVIDTLTLRGSFRF